MNYRKKSVLIYLGLMIFFIPFMCQLVTVRADPPLSASNVTLSQNEMLIWIFTTGPDDTIEINIQVHQGSVDIIIYEEEYYLTSYEEAYWDVYYSRNIEFDAWADTFYVTIYSIQSEDAVISYTIKHIATTLNNAIITVVSGLIFLAIIIVVDRIGGKKRG